MPDQPSKESLERATPKEFVLSIWPRATAFLANMYWPGQGERKKWIVLRSSSESMSQVQADSEEDAWKLAAYKITAQELRQQNAALVEALRDLTAQWNIIANTIDDGTHTTECGKRACDFRSRAKEVTAILGDAAPADAPENEGKGEVSR